MGETRFRYFTTSYLETDLWIGIDPGSYHEEIEVFTLNKIIELRKILENYGRKNNEFLRSFSPVESTTDAPGIIREMTSVSNVSGSGPMASVAGAFAQFIGRSIIKKYNVNELIIENGGDCFIKIKEPLNISVFAGNSPFSGKTGLSVTPEYSPLGICTSSGRFGHSTSFGKADAVMLACKNTLLADAYATIFCNKILRESDMESVLAEIKLKKLILAAILIFREKIGITGKFKFKLFDERFVTNQYVGVKKL